MAFAVGHYWFWGRRRTELQGGRPYFLRRAICEPVLERTERWGAGPDERPTALVAVANPERELARLRLARALVGREKGRDLAVNVFAAGGEQSVTDELVSSYYDAIARREAALDEAVVALGSSGPEVVSHVPVSTSVFYGLVSAADASRASTILLGWPGPATSPGGPLPLPVALDKYLRADLLVFREAGPVPAANILTVVDKSIHGRLALPVAARLANAWDSDLTVASLVDTNADEAHVADVEDDLETLVSDLARATVQVLPGRSAADLAGEAAFHDLTIVSVAAGHRPELLTAMQELDGVTHASILLVRGHASQTLDTWM